MAFKLAEAYVQLSSRGFGGVSGTIDQIAGKTIRMGSALSTVTGMLPGIGTILAGLGATAGIAGMVKMAADAESTAISFEVLLGSASDAQKILKELNDFARATPFDFPGVANAAKTMLSFGVAGDEIMDDIRMLSDVAQGDAQKLGSLALVFGQIASAGKLTGGDLLQLVNAGFNPLQVISEKTGESVSSLRDKMSEGLITFDQVKDAFRAATSEGGLFFQMNDKQSKTLKGLWANLGEGVGSQLRGIGQSIVEAFDLHAVLSGAIDFSDRFGSVFQSILTDLVPSTQKFLGALSESFGSLWDSVSGGASIVDLMIGGLKSVGEWATWMLDTVTFVIDNWGLLWSIAVERLALAFENMPAYILNWASNGLTIVEWFFENWKDVFITLGDFTVTVFKNLAKNIAAALQPVHTSIAEMMLRATATVMGTSQEELEQQIQTLHEDAGRRSIPFTGLTEGFKSSISELPELTEASIQKSTPLLDALYQQLGENAMKAFDKPDTPGGFAKRAENIRSREKNNNTGSASGGGQARFVGLSELSKGIQTGVLGNKSEKYAKETSDATKKLAGAVGSDGKLKTNPGPAVAGS